MSHMGFIRQTKSKIEISNLIEPKFTHACIIGETGCGKTTSMINTNLNNRLSLGHGILVFDHKGNYHTTVKALANRHDRLDDVIVLGLPWGRKCNILEDMDESAFIDFIKGAVGHSDDKFWEQSAIDLALPIIRVLDAIEKLNKFKIFQSLIKKNNENYTRSISSLYKITTSRESIKSFYNSLDYLLISNTRTKLQTMINNIDKNQDSKFKDAVKAYMYFEDMYNNFFDSIINTNQINDKSSKTFDSIILSLNKPLGSLALHSYINENDININESLNEGKIIVFLCNQLPENVLAGITQSIFRTFNERIGRKNQKDITIFIDEAQRVLNKEIDLPIDTLREARVDVFTAYQSKTLLVNKIGLIKAEALDVNLTSRFYFKSNSYEDDINTSELKPFSFLCNLDDAENIHKAIPLFLEDDELFNAEYSYQRKVKAFKMFQGQLPTMRKKRYILKFVPSLYSKGKISTVDSNGDEKLYNFSSPFSLKKYKKLKDQVLNHFSATESAFLRLKLN